jgi:hypothetical protein
MHGEKSIVYRVLAGNPEAKSHRPRFEDNIKMDVRNIAWYELDSFRSG